MRVLLALVRATFILLRFFLSEPKFDSMMLEGPPGVRQKAQAGIAGPTADAGEDDDVFFLALEALREYQFVSELESGIQKGVHRRRPC